MTRLRNAEIDSIAQTWCVEVASRAQFRPGIAAPIRLHGASDAWAGRPRFPELGSDWRGVVVGSGHCGWIAQGAGFALVVGCGILELGGYGARGG